MLMAFSPKIWVIFEMGFSLVTKMAVTSVFFLALDTLKLASSSAVAAFWGSAVIMRMTPNSPDSAMQRA